MSVNLRWRGLGYLLVLTLAMILVVVWWPEFSGIWREHSGTFAVITLLMAFSMLVQARNFTTFLVQSNGPGLVAMGHVWALGSLANYVGPFQPGVALRVALLARAGIPVAESSVAALRQVFASLWLSLLVAAISLILLKPVAMAIPALALIAAFAAISQVLPMLRRFANRWLTRSARVNLKDHVERAISLPSMRSGIGILVQYALSAGMFCIGYRQFGVDISVGAALGLASIVYASSAVALLPGNFGVLEALCTAFGQTNGLPVEESLALAFLYRGANLAGALLLAALPISIRSQAKEKAGA